MSDSKHDFIRFFLLYLAKLIFAVLLTFIIMIPVTNIIRLFPHISGTNTENIVFGTVSVAVEVVIFAVMSFKDFYNGKTSSVKIPFLSFFSALVLQFILAAASGFAAYTAGFGIMYLGAFFYYVISGEKYIFPVTDVPDIPFSYFLIPMVVLDILMLASFFLSFFMAKRRADKEKIHE